MKRLLLVTALAAAICGCTDKLATIGEQVKGEMLAEYTAKTSYRNLKLDKVSLINVEGNRYTGFAFGRIGEHEVKFDLDCVADGKNVKWTAKPSDGCDFSFLAQEGAANLCADAKAAAGELCERASDAASNLCESAEAAWKSGKAAAAEGLEKAGETLGGIVDGVKSAVGGALEKTGEAVKSVGESVRSAPAPEAK